jgi:transposase
MTRERDFRKLKPAAQVEARRNAVAMVKSGMKRIEVADIIGVNRRFVGEWVAAEAALGPVALDSKKRGRRPGEQKALTPDEEKKICQLIADKCPDQLKLPFALWTREAVALLIERKTTKRLSIQVVGDYLASWGMSPQRPMRRATERNDADVQRWMRESYPEIAERAKTEGAEIHWGDETGVSNQANYGRSYAPVAETPVIPRPATRFTQSMISSVTNRGRMEFMIYDGALNVVIFLMFLTQLIKYRKRKIFLIVDNLRVHKAKAVAAWAAKHKDRIELFYLPPYAPDCNPDEFLNNDLKQAIAKRRTPRTKDALRNEVRSHLEDLQARPAKVRAFFQAKSVRYAA